MEPQPDEPVESQAPTSADHAHDAHTDADEPVPADVHDALTDAEAEGAALAAAATAEEAEAADALDDADARAASGEPTSTRASTAGPAPVEVAPPSTVAELVAA